MLISLFAVWLGSNAIYHLDRHERTDLFAREHIEPNGITKHTIFGYKFDLDTVSRNHFRTAIHATNLIAATCSALGVIVLLIFSFRDQSVFHRAKWLASLGLAISCCTGLSILSGQIAMNPDSVMISSTAAFESKTIFLIACSIILITFLIQPESMPITKKVQQSASKPKPNPKAMG
ncbi:hypothetical protein KS4_13190 [Poriferisphaera corsica]|uniref:Uncharacterized protein n=1 Tax=Poriferisphaera corsica TaxID=2528020 RepID=A0A517YSQ5_9BACT|nr:hypothetical protein [Poriferisphaera corsica]QDU33273.1 hypothetical protein KS4_13190 [Poriferisphaera corsica]